MGYLKDKRCKECGNVFTAKSANGKFCKDCAPLIAIKRKENSDRARYTVFERDDFKCVYCGKSSIEDGVKLVLDHAFPHCIGGENSLYNLVTACEECNFVKGHNELQLSVYRRIVNRNIEKNKGISPQKAEWVNKVLDEYFNTQKRP